MKFKKRYVIIPVVVIFIIVLGIAILIKLDRDYQKKVIDQDEAEYGNEYLKLEDSLSYYTGNPDRIIYKPKMKDYFYVIDKNDENYAHLLEVAEDRMSYSLMTPLTDDFNVDSMDRIMSSGKNYIILDYDKEKYANIGVDDGTTPRPVVYKLLDDNRCARLFKYVTQFMKRYTMEELEEMLGKTGFSRDDVNVEVATQEEMNDGYTMIYTIDDFRRIANNPSGKYKLVNDLDLEGDTLLYTITGFTGELDGNGHTIKNITKNLANDETERIVMFYTNEGNIKNLNIENINIISDKDTSYPEGIIAQVNKGTIENCTISGNVTITSETGNNSIGGIVGSLLEGTIKDCVSKVNITCLSGTIGGISVYQSGGTIENCTNTGNLVGANVNGICVEYIGTLANCTNIGNITASNIGSGMVTYNQGEIINCQNHGTITSENGMVTGIAIYNHATIANCVNEGQLTGCNIVGGIAGINGDPNGAEGMIINCTSTDILTINTSSQYVQDISYIGGIAGNHILGNIEGCSFDGGIVVNTNKTTYQGILAGAKSSKAEMNPSTGYGHNYDFETYYDEHAMETLND